MNKFIVILALGIFVCNAFAFSTLGNDFFLVYPANACREPASVPPDPASFYNGQIILTSSFATTGTVRNFDGSWTRAFSIPPNGVTTISVDSTLWIRPSETIRRRGLRIQSDNDISAYFLSYESPGSTNDLALLYPVNSIGTDYMVMCWRDNIPTYSALTLNRGPSMFAIVATEDGTNVQITPSAATEGGHAAGVMFSVTLNSYDCYQVLANSPNATTLRDLTGSRIVSDKPIVVLAGNQIALVPDVIMAADFLVEQIPPLLAWGMNFCCFPVTTRGDWSKDVLRVLASQDNTTITITDGSGTVSAIRNAGQYFEWNGQPCDEGVYDVPFLSYAASCDNKMLDSPTRITTDKPVLVGQYITGGTLTRGEPDWLTGEGEFEAMGDPAYMLVPPVEQYSARYIFLTPAGYNNDYLNVAIPVGFESSVRIDGGIPIYTTAWFNLPGGTHRGARISVEPGGHVIEADTSFMLQMYGFDYNWASYASVAGQNLLPINAEYLLRKECLLTPVFTGTQTAWRIVVVHNSGDPATRITITDTLPLGFTLAASPPPTVTLYGGATRTATVDPVAGSRFLTWGNFSCTRGDSIAISFYADINLGVVGRFDNGISIADSAGGTGTTNGGVGLPDDDVVVYTCDTINASWQCPEPCNSWTSCPGQTMELFMWTDSTAIDTARVYFTVSDGVSAPYVISGADATVSFSCLSLDCDSVTATISGITWTNLATVTVTLDSAYMTDGCKTIFHP